MKMTINDVSIFNAQLEKLKAKNLPVKLSYIISKNSTILQAELKAADETRLDLCKKMAKKDKDGNPVMVKKSDGSEAYDIENMSELVGAVAELYQTETDVDLRTIDATIEEVIDSCDDPKYDALSAYDIETLEKMIKPAE